MKKKIMIMPAVFCLCAHTAQSQLIDPVSLIIAKAVKAMDLKVQHLQNETLILQAAQQAAEQELSKNQLTQIARSQQELSKLYTGYFSELRQIRPSITDGALVKAIVNSQQQVVLEYGRSGKDPALRLQYDALLRSSRGILQIMQQTLSNGLSMKDAERITVLQSLKEAMNQCLESIQVLNREQLEIFSERSRMQDDNSFVKCLYGIR